MSGVGPVAHIHGSPWREPDLTECGKSLADYPPDRLTTVQKLVADIGAQRASFRVCMTCWMRAVEETQTPNDVTPPDPDALLDVARPVADCNRGQAERSDDTRQRKHRLLAELEAIAALVAAYRDEFDGFLADRAEAPSLSAARTKRRAERRRKLS